MPTIYYMYIQHSQLFQIRNVYENLTFKLAINNQYCDLA
jgi:hypothetical protein